MRTDWELTGETMPGMGTVPCYLLKLYYKDFSRDPAGESEEEPSTGDRLTLQTDRLKGETHLGKQEYFFFWRIHLSFMKLKSFIFSTVLVSQVNQEIILSLLEREFTLLWSLAQAQQWRQFLACDRHNRSLKSTTKPSLPPHDSCLLPSLPSPLAEDTCVQSSNSQQHSPRPTELRGMPCLMHSSVDTERLSFVLLHCCMEVLKVTKFAAGCLLECLAIEVRKFQSYQHSKWGPWSTCKYTFKTLSRVLQR